MLDLRGNKITDAGLEHLKGLTQLVLLFLSDTKITGAGLEHVKGLTQLSDLILSGSDITDAGLEHLKGLTHLRDLDLSGTDIRDAKLLVSTGSSAIASALTTSEIVIRLEQFDFPSSDFQLDTVSEYVKELLVREVVNIWHTKSEINATMNSFYSDVSGTPNQDWAQHLASDLLRIMKCNSAEQFVDAAQSAGMNLLETQTNPDLFEIGSEEYKSFSEFVTRAINEYKSR